MKTSILRTFAVTALSTLVIVSADAQDTLNFKDGNRTLVNVTEITSTLVKYKKMENLDGPSYTDLKNDIASISYKNGVFEKFAEPEPPETPVVMNVTTSLRPTEPVFYSIQPFGKTKFIYGNRVIGNKEMHSVLLSVGDPRISSMITTAKKQARAQYIGFLAIPFGILSAGLAADANGFNDQTLAAGILGTLGVASFATSITLKSKRTRNEQAALKLYRTIYQ